MQLVPHETESALACVAQGIALADTSSDARYCCPHARECILERPNGGLQAWRCATYCCNDLSCCASQPSSTTTHKDCVQHERIQITNADLTLENLDRPIPAHTTKQPPVD
eukprot:GHUV01034045.1.p2 GENE.GHUV01034045.1~~GHUV01034045.1.p2  ORF type:complete len:110 (+),score=12.72 GHUV01034045.1:605-934(+)